MSSLTGGLLARTRVQSDCHHLAGDSSDVTCATQLATSDVCHSGLSVSLFAAHAHSSQIGLLKIGLLHLQTFMYVHSLRACCCCSKQPNEVLVILKRFRITST